MEQEFTGANEKLGRGFLPQFQAFFDDRLVAQQFDFVVPLETKGMLILNELDARSTRGKTRVVYRRSFDFMDPDTLRGKRVAIVDDTLFTGRSLNKAEERLHERGVEATSKYAFLVIDDVATARCRRAHDITSCATLPRAEFEFLLDDLSALSRRNRPVSPDHLHYVLRLNEPVVAEALLDCLTNFGFVVEYERDANAVTASIHYPTFSCDNANASDRIDKVRIAVKNHGRLIQFCPELFPRLEPNDTGIGAGAEGNGLRAKLLASLTMAHQDAHAKSLNRYESFTLAARIKQAANFVAVLRESGMPAAPFTIDSHQLARYYGPQVGARVVEIAQEETERLFEQGVPAQQPVSESADFDFPDIFTLAEKLLRSLKGAYESRNEGEADLYLWESAGLSMTEIAANTGLPREVVSVGIEHLNDYGYATPMTHPDDAGRIERKYRSTEIGTARLAL